jgi:hypothetical protein
VTRLLSAFGLVVTLVLVVGAASLWTSRASAQLARPGEDPRAMSARIVEPLPLPVTGEVTVTATAPLPVRISDAPGSAALAAPSFVEEGRCYFLDLTGATRWRDVLWRVEGVQGSWVRARPARISAGVDADAAWFNLTRVSRISDPMRCD